MRAKGRAVRQLRNRVFAWLRLLEKQGQEVSFTRVTCEGACGAAELLASIRVQRGASYIAIVGVAPAALGAAHVHVLHTGKLSCAIAHERHTETVRAGAGSSYRLAGYVAHHLGQKPAGVGRSWRASGDFPQERALGLPPVLAGAPEVDRRRVHAGLYWWAHDKGLPVSLRVYVRARGRVDLVGEGVGLFLCGKTGLFWPDLPGWRALDNPRSSQHWRMCQDAARHANGRAGEGRGVVWPSFVLQLSLRQHFRCYWCDRSLLTPCGPKWHLDHILPLSAGGENKPPNVALCCPRCNRSKAGLSPQAFIYRLAARGVASAPVKAAGVGVQLALWRGRP